MLAKPCLSQTGLKTNFFQFYFFWALTGFTLYYACILLRLFGCGGFRWSPPHLNSRTQNTALCAASTPGLKTPRSTGKLSIITRI